MVVTVKFYEPRVLITAGAYPGFCSMKRLGVLLLVLDGMLVHRREPPRFPKKFAGTHFLLGRERHCESKVSFPRTHHHDPARARTRTSRSGDQRANH